MIFLAPYVISRVRTRVPAEFSCDAGPSELPMKPNRSLRALTDGDCSLLPDVKLLAAKVSRCCYSGPPENSRTGARSAKCWMKRSPRVCPTSFHGAPESGSLDAVSY